MYDKLLDLDFNINSANYKQAHEDCCKLQNLILAALLEEEKQAMQKEKELGKCKEKIAQAKYYSGLKID
jgi:hypothetical protein